MYLRIMLWYGDLNSESPHGEVFQVLVYGYCSAVKRYGRQDLIQIAVSVWSYAIQQSVYDLKEWKAGGC